MKGLKIMKTTKNIKVMGYRLWVIVVMAVLPVLNGAWQTQAVEYKNMYHGVSHQMSDYSGQVAVPTVTFQSTSAYSGSWSQSEVASINADGTVNEGVYMASHRGGLRKDPSPNPGTPDEDDDDDDQQPLGDGLWVMMVLLAVYCASRVYRRKRDAGM